MFLVVLVFTALVHDFLHILGNVGLSSGYMFRFKYDVHVILFLSTFLTKTLFPLSIIAIKQC